MEALQHLVHEVLALLTQLGVNQTAFATFLIFFITLNLLRYIAFEPYYRAYEERQSRTKGGEEKAQSIHDKTKELRVIYEEQARNVSAEVASIFEKENQIAKKECESILTQARTTADKYLLDARNLINEEVSKASDQLKAEAPGLAKLISKKMLS